MDSYIASMDPITRKSIKGDLRIRILFLTNNPSKKEEYEKTFSTYGSKLYYVNDEEICDNPTNENILKILSKEEPTPHYIIRETTKLENAMTGETISGRNVIENPSCAPPFVLNISNLEVWIPFWDSKTNTLKDMDHKTYIHSFNGYIDPKRESLKTENTFGWDHLFVNPQTGKSLQESTSDIYGKISSRQLVLSDFITNHLFYKKPQSLRFNKELLPKQGIDFSEEMSVGKFFSENKYLSNPHLKDWGLLNIHTNIINEGVFFKAATCRPVKNYFSPPFGGIPLTAKKSQAEETIFMYHDLNHHNIPDLICDFKLPESNHPEIAIQMRNVYCVWRMMSEAMTLVIADMLYADSLVKTDGELRSVVDQRIYPLFESLNLIGTREEKIKSLLYANTRYAILGDDSVWRKLLIPGKEDKLDAYKNHFEKFFIGDHVWTFKNYNNMEKMKSTMRKWVELVTPDEFRNAGTILLSDVVRELSQMGSNLSSIHSTVPCVFDYIIKTRIFPIHQQNHQQQSEVQPISESIRKERAYRRYIIGQMSFYSHYMEIEGMLSRGEKISQMLKQSVPFTNIYNQYCQDVHYLLGKGIISIATAHNYLQVHPIFPPIFIAYGRQSSKSIQEALMELYNENLQSFNKQKQQSFEHIKEYMKNKMMFLTGYPGSGKGTQGKQLSEQFGIAHLSTGELFRAEAASGSDVGKQMDEYMQKGQIIPKELTFSYLKSELSKNKYKNGFLLDGYPKDTECREFIIETLKELQYEVAAALYFDVSRESVTERLSGRLHCFTCEHDYHILFHKPKIEQTCDHCSSTLQCRKDDQIDTIKKRLDVFEQRTNDVLQYFSDSKLIIHLNSWKPPMEVFDDICRIIEEKRNVLLYKGGSYFSRLPLNNNPRSSRFHNHIDAKNHMLLSKIISLVDEKSNEFQNKIYPISSLCLGPQCSDAAFSGVYSCLPNFHNISCDTNDEAFSTGGMGTEGFDYQQVLATLETASTFSGQGVMTELEEDIYENEFDVDGNSKILLDVGETPYTMDWSHLPNWKEKMISNVPKFELHHGVDILKLPNEVGVLGTGPIDLDLLHKKTRNSDFCVGGWFVFRKEDRWAYRSNEFSNADYSTCMKRLLEQAKALREIVSQLAPNRPFTSSCSLEKVHAMWSFPGEDVKEKIEQESESLPQQEEQPNNDNSQTNNWSNMSYITSDGVQEVPVSFLVKQISDGKKLGQLNKTMTSVWTNKLDPNRNENIQRTPDVTVDSICCKIGKDGMIWILLGVVDKSFIPPGESNPERCHGLVFPGGGHYERIGGRVEGTSHLFEPSHGSSVQAHERELMEEVSLSCSSALLRDVIAVMDVPDYCTAKQCVRVIFGNLLNPNELPKTSDEITETFWVPLDQVISIAQKKTSFNESSSKQPLYFTFHHGEMFLAVKNCSKFNSFKEQCVARARSFWDSC